MKQFTLVIVLILIATTAMANQHDEKKMMASSDSMSASTMRQLDPFVGKWQCTGTAFASPWGPEHPTTGEVSQGWVLDGKWVNFTYAEKKTAQNPMPFTVMGYFGYDPEIKMYVIGSVDSAGGYSTGSSSGWVGDAMTFEGPWHIGGMTSKSRDTFTKKGMNEMSHLGELEQNGAWMKLVQERCTRK